MSGVRVPGVVVCLTPRRSCDRYRPAVSYQRWQSGNTATGSLTIKPHKQMRNSTSGLLLAALAVLSGCTAQSEQTDAAPAASAASPASTASGQASVVYTVSMPTIAKVAAGSADHTTLVAALKAANLVDVLATPGPFTVFAPNNGAFAKLPKATVDDLLKPENKDKLAEILQHHVMTSAFDLDAFSDGQEISMVSAGSERITKKDGATFIGGAKVIGSVRASNGWVHIVDGVLVPAAKP